MERDRIKVLMYHRVSDKEAASQDYSWTVTQSQLRQHLKLLQKWGYTCISFQDCSLSRSGLLTLPKKPVILTFDDGYADVFLHALPVLREFGVKATVFVLGDRSIKSNLWDPEEKYGRVSLLNDEMISELHRLGFEIGSHSMTHRALETLAPEQAWKEISESKESLEDLLDAPVTSFAYPFGKTTEQLKEMVKRAGYEFGCGSYTGPPRFSTDRFDIRRTQITSDSNLLDFTMKMRTPYSYYRWMMWKIRKGLPVDRKASREELGPISLMIPNDFKNSKV